MLDGLVLAVPHRETGNIAVVCSTLCYDSVFRILADSEPGERARHLVEPIVGCSRALLDCGVTREGLTEATAGAQVVIDLTNPPSF